MGAVVKPSYDSICPSNGRVYRDVRNEVVVVSVRIRIQPVVAVWWREDHGGFAVEVTALVAARLVLVRIRGRPIVEMDLDIGKVEHPISRLTDLASQEV